MCRNPHRPLSLFYLPWLLLVLAGHVEANKNRSIWFWNSSSSPYGSANIVGVSALENQTIAFFNARDIRRVYGSYQDRPLTDSATIAAWNAKLDANGIQSQLLIDGTDYIFVADRPGLITRIDDRLIGFNGASGRLPEEKFDALHLDLEPQALPEWGPPPPAIDISPSQKRDYLILLRDTYAEVRQHLDDNGFNHLKIYADLPVTWEKLPVDGGSVGWLDAADRDQWYDDVAAILDGITLMAFQRNSFSSIDNGVAWERANISGATVRVGIQPILGANPDWPSLPDFNAMLETLESNYGPSGAVDIENYRRWREAIASQPIVAVAAEMKHFAGGPGIGFDGIPGWSYSILASLDLCLWREVKRYRVQEQGEIKYDLGEIPPRQFYRVERFEELDHEPR